MAADMGSMNSLAEDMTQYGVTVIQRKPGVSCLETVTAVADYQMEYS